jgi:RNA polymerase sigma factor (sigma-70 family)
MELATLYNLYVDDLFTYGCYLGFDGEIVKDAIHDVFVKLTMDDAQIKEITNIKFYLFKSLKNRLLDIYKKLKREVVKDNFAPFDEMPYGEMPFHITMNVEEDYIEKEEQIVIKKEIDEMLNSLTSRQREIIYLRYVHEYEYNEIAELLHISVHSCRKLVSKAILSLREKYGIAFLIFSQTGFFLSKL